MEIRILWILITILTTNLIFAQTYCEKAKLQATLDFHNSIYSFHSEEILPVEQTYFYVLREYYKINWYFTDSLGYYNCYDNKMIELLKTKYGENFLNRAHVLTDSLDKTENWKKDAEYPDGQQAFTKFINLRLKKNKINKPDNNSKVYIMFTISTTGRILNPKIVRGINGNIDKEILTILKKMPKWEPAYLYGKPINQGYMIQIKLE